MSRLANKPISIPDGVKVTLDDILLVVTGRLGELQRSFTNSAIAIRIEEDGVVLERKDDTKESQSLLGTYASHVSNMIHGVSDGYEKRLIVEGVGFRSEVKGKNLELALGFSHPVSVPIPDGLEITAEKNVITVRGIDKDLVGGFASQVRLLKKPEPYKGKGIRYDGEQIIRKQGKRAA